MTERQRVRVVVGAAVLRGDRCLVARRGPGMSQSGRWEFPGGKVEPGESEAEALVRELREELDLAIEVGALIERHPFKGAGGRRYELAVYRARALPGSVPRPLEHAALRWCRASEMRRLRWTPADLPALDALLASWPASGGEEAG